mgnify:CR=1 FL=1|jgi:hypothetical protein
MDTVAAELMEWEELSLEDLEDFDREARSEEQPISDPLTLRVSPQIRESAPASAERTHRLRRALATTSKGDPLRGVSP